ncbi:hypothetical protein KNP414_02305 [Paenibacillus mucilaginosus KNP414]|uniref:Uncharacterized protein n=1 Tax=Paenibacillus mucilaginosus (strain KNP414) TaxID=1036673 RepID=F8F7W2_PAEMK|nr:hypothetical protein KNP414_02305 [Paenibacillus mucilaginosus KNP414]
MGMRNSNISIKENIPFVCNVFMKPTSKKQLLQRMPHDTIS